MMPNPICVKTNDYLAHICEVKYDELVAKSTNKVLLSDVVEVRYGKDHKKLRDGAFPLYGSGGIMRYVEQPLYASGESVLIPRKGTLNNVMYISEPFWSVDTMFYTIMKKSNIAKYVYYFMTKQDLSSMNTGSAVPSMTTDILNAMEITMPDDGALKSFDEGIQPLFDTMKNNDKQNSELSMIRDTLLPKLMSGEIDVSALDLGS